MGFIGGEGRTQATMFPVTLVEFIPGRPRSPCNTRLWNVWW